MDFSIIIPSKSEGNNLHATVESVIAASAKADFEIIAVDDVSDDFSGDDLAREYAKNKRVSVIRNDERLGVAGSRNRGAQDAAGDILIFLDAHTFVPEGWLEHIADAISQHSEKAGRDTIKDTIYSTVIGQIYPEGAEIPEPEVFSFQSKFEAPTLQQTIDPDGKPTGNAYPIQLIEGAVMIFGKHLFAELDGFDRGLIPPWGQESHEICFRNWRLGGECRILPNLLIRTLYREQFPYAGVYHDRLIANKLRLAYCLFSDERFERVLDALMDDELFGQFTAAAVRMLMQGDAHARREDLRKQFTRTDDDIIERFTNSIW